MTRLNRKVEYALIALKFMSVRPAGVLTTVKEICAATNVPFDATSRVMQLMVQKKILKAELGAHGGYTLTQDLSRVSFLEIIEIVTGPVESVRCLSSDEPCELISSCNMTSPFRRFNQKLIGFYKSLTIAELLQSEEFVRKDERVAVELQ